MEELSVELVGRVLRRALSEGGAQTTRALRGVARAFVAERGEHGNRALYWSRRVPEILRSLESAGAVERVLSASNNTVWGAVGSAAPASGRGLGSAPVRLVAPIAVEVDKAPYGWLVTATCPGCGRVRKARFRGESRPMGGPSAVCGSCKKKGLRVRS